MSGVTAIGTQKEGVQPKINYDTLTIEEARTIIEKQARELELKEKELKNPKKVAKVDKSNEELRNSLKAVQSEIDKLKEQNKKPVEKSLTTRKDLLKDTQELFSQNPLDIASPDDPASLEFICRKCVEPPVGVVLKMEALKPIQALSVLERAKCYTIAEKGISILEKIHWCYSDNDPNELEVTENMRVRALSDGFTCHHRVARYLMLPASGLGVRHHKLTGNGADPTSMMIHLLQKVYGAKSVQPKTRVFGSEVYNKIGLLSANLKFMPSSPIGPVIEEVELYPEYPVILIIEDWMTGEKMLDELVEKLPEGSALLPGLIRETDKITGLAALYEKFKDKHNVAVISPTAITGSKTLISVSHRQPNGHANLLNVRLWYEACKEHAEMMPPLDPKPTVAHDKEETQETEHARREKRRHSSDRGRYHHAKRHHA